MTVIRDAVIRIRTERSGQVGGGYESRAFAAEAKAAREAGKEVVATDRAVVEHNKTLRESAHVVDDFGFRYFRSFDKAGRGAVQLTRAFALMAASNEADTQKLIGNLVKIEAGVSAISGGAKLAQFAAGFGPVGIAVAATTALVGVGTVAWRNYHQEIEATKRANEEFERDALKGRDERGVRTREQGAAGQSLQRDIFARRTGASFSDEERGRRLTGEKGFLRSRLGELDAADEARIQAEMASRPEWQRPIRGTPAHRQRIIDRRRAEAGQPVGPGGIDAEYREQEERKAIAERQLQVEREIFQLNQQELQQKRDQMIQSAQGLFGSSSGAGNFVRQAADQMYESGLRERERKHQESADTIVKIWEGAAQEMQTIYNSRAH